jgi:hypothetical protein
MMRSTVLDDHDPALLPVVGVCVRLERAVLLEPLQRERLRLS